MLKQKSIHIVSKQSAHCTNCPQQPFMRITHNDDDTKKLTVALKVENGASIIFKSHSHASQGEEERSTRLAATLGIDAAESRLRMKRKQKKGKQGIYEQVGIVSIKELG